MKSDFKEEVKKGERFEFGKNWKDFLNTVNDAEIQKAENDIKHWLGTDAIAGKRIIDIGSGSGIHSAVFYKMGAKELLSFDYDNDSVEATRKTWGNAGSPANWKIMQGSVLDEDFLQSLGTFDIVYSWGVLHHTGQMWKAIENAISLVKPGGVFWIAIYQKGPAYARHLKLKTKYNSASPVGRKMMIYGNIFKIMVKRIVSGKNPFTWNEKTDRGMNIYNDLVDWLGGLPYEVASKEEILAFCKGLHLEIKEAETAPEGGCSIYLFNKLNTI